MNIDRIYYINCDHRLDRKLHIESLLSSLNINNDIIQRVSGVYIPENGSLGCVRSHIKILNDSIENNYENILVLEDDFEINEINKFVENINKVNKIEYDIIMLACNLKKYITTEYDFLYKVLEAQTSSAYILNKKFSKYLLKSYKESERELEKNMDSDLYALDQNWKKIQPKYKWFCFNPLLGMQMESWSDIEKKNTNYKC